MSRNPYKLYVPKPDGSIAVLDPHIQPGSAGMVAGQLLSPNGKPTPHLARKVAYQQGILDRVEKWNLWQFFEEPGRMTAEYRRMRRDEEELQVLLSMARMKLEGRERANVKLQVENYELPGSIYMGEAISEDFLIDKELEACYMFVLTNTKKDPQLKIGKDGYTEAIAKEYRESIIKIDAMPPVNWNMMLGPGRSIALKFSADKYYKPRPVAPLEFQRYEHWNPNHNTNLSTRLGGSYASYTAQETIPAPEVKADVKR